jgi:high affinity Mn2+ porin
MSSRARIASISNPSWRAWRMKTSRGRSVSSSCLRLLFVRGGAFVSQYAFPFHAPYSGQNLKCPARDVGCRFVHRCPAVARRRTMDQSRNRLHRASASTFGVAGFTRAEAHKVGQSTPYTRLPRMFMRQTNDLRGDAQKFESGINQFAGSTTSDRLVITVAI